VAKPLTEFSAVVAMQPAGLGPEHCLKTACIWPTVSRTDGFSGIEKGNKYARGKSRAHPVVLHPSNS